MITYKMIQEWIDLYTNQKITCTEISEKYNVSKTTVMKYLKNFNIKLTRNRSHRSLQLYKGKYLITIYDIDDIIRWQFDNAREMSDKLDLTRSQVACILCRYWRRFRYKNNWYHVKLVEEDEK